MRSVAAGWASSTTPGRSPAIGEEDGTHYYAMELIEGQALSEVLQDLSGSGTNPLMDATLTMMAGVEEQADPAPALHLPYFKAGARPIESVNH